jgi:hypothetical protein
MGRRGKLLVVAALVVSLMTVLSGCAPGSWWHSGGPRIHFTIAEGCPPRTKPHEDVVNQDQASSPLLRISKVPTASLVCLYGYWYASGALPTAVIANKLIASVRLDSHDSAALGRKVVALSLAQPSGVTSCPNDMVGVSALLAFTYADGTTTDLNYHDTGCQSLDNGTVAASQIGSASFEAFQTTLTSQLAPRLHVGES